MLEVVESDIVDAVGANVNIAAQWMAAVGLADPSCVFAINTEVILTFISGNNAISRFLF